MIHYYTADGTFVGYMKWKAGRWHNYNKAGREFGLPRKFIVETQADARRYFETGLRLVS